jgi:cyclase
MRFAARDGPEAVALRGHGGCWQTGSMNRRRFLADTATMAALALVFRNHGLLAQTAPASTGAPRPPGADAVVPTSFVPLRRNVGIFNGSGGTIGWLASAEALAVVDTQFPATAAI